MEFNAAVVEESGYRFAIIIVTEQVLDSPNLEELRQRFKHYFDGSLEIIFMVDQENQPVFDGKKEIVALLEAKSILQINDLPWLLRHT